MAEMNLTPCLTCHDPETGESTGQSERGWSGHVSADGTTCFDCRGTGFDKSTYGVGNDSCPWCGVDWKQEHTDECPPGRPGN